MLPAILKITEDYVLALEQGQFERLPAPAFARGYIKNYAKLLGLDGDILARRFDGCVKTEDKQKSFLEVASKPMLERRSSPLVRYAITLASVVAIVFTSYYWWHKNKMSSTNVDPQVAVNMESAATPAATVSSDDDSIISGSEESDEVAQNDSSSDENTADSTLNDDVVDVDVDDEIEQPIPVHTSELQPLEAANLYIRFKGDCWIEIKDMGGKVLVSGLKKAGSELDVSVPSAVRLRLGNAPGVDSIKFAGHTVDMSTRSAGKRVAKLTLNASEPS